MKSRARRSKQKALRPRRLRFQPKFERLSHYLFRYPAKFHPPVVAALLDRYTKRGETVLDPFVGSGTLLVEAAARGRNSIGLDVDPVAIAVATAKVGRYGPAQLEQSASKVRKALKPLERPSNEYERRKFEDLGDVAFRRERKKLKRYIPDIPGIEHWFRRYVIIDLARILRAVRLSKIPKSHARLLEVVFASIIRNASNADPVPVSGLEVTSHMKERDAAGRLVNPFALYRDALGKALDGAAKFHAVAVATARVRAACADATAIPLRLAKDIDAVITSPPYQSAVDYYRRHTLEMYWLGFTRTVADRRKLLTQYIGRHSVPRRDSRLAEVRKVTKLVGEWETRIEKVSPKRADAFRHYVRSMADVFGSLAVTLRPGAPAVFVVGHSMWNGTEIPTSKIFRELAGPWFELEEILVYPIKNRYMSYSRHNGADIKREFVLVLRRTPLQANLETGKNDQTGRHNRNDKHQSKNRRGASLI